MKPLRRAKAVSGTARRIVRDALAHGRKRALALSQLRKKSLAKGSPVNGLVVAEGDSWFDYPFFDVLERLETKFGFRVESVAHKGDTVEDMAYNPSQLAKLSRLFERLGQQQQVPRAILLSGGGNDIAGTEFAVLLNHAASGMTPLNDKVVDGILNERLRFAISSLIGAVTELSRQHFSTVVPVIVHGYGHAVPDGRGVLGGFWILPGPWLKPGFDQKGYLDLAQNSQVTADLIDRFNAMLASLPAFSGMGHVSYLDLRGTLSNVLARGQYKQSWGNELHPTKAGFETVAQLFSTRIKTFPMPPAPKARPVAAPKRARVGRRPATRSRRETPHT